MMCYLNSVDPSPNWQEAQGKALASIRDSGPTILEKSLAPLWLNFFIHKMGKRCLSNLPQGPINSDDWGRYEWKHLVPRLQPNAFLSSPLSFPHQSSWSSVISLLLSWQTRLLLMHFTHFCTFPWQEQTWIYQGQSDKQGKDYGNKPKRKACKDKETTRRAIEN